MKSWNSGKIILKKSFQIGKFADLKILKIELKKVEYKAFSEAITRLYTLI